MMSLEQKAREFATHHHGAIGQVRKYTGEPYINHPAAVVALLRTVPHTEEMLAAAWLHDVVEDTPVTLPEIVREFGPLVGGYVYWLTDESCPEDGNRAARKAIDRAHLAEACPEAKTIKLADMIDNSRSILERGPDFARIYLKEKKLLLGVLKEGDSTLWEIAANIVRNADQTGEKP